VGNTLRESSQNILSATTNTSFNVFAVMSCMWACRVQDFRAGGHGLQIRHAVRQHGPFVCNVRSSMVTSGTPPA
jgi:hypothetical protein